MRPLVIGVSAALALAAAIAASATFAAKDPNIDVVAPLIVQAGVTCTPVEVRMGPGDVVNPDKSTGKLYEVSCQEGMGYELVKKNNTKTPELGFYQNCMQAAQPGPDGKPGNAVCKLAGNAHPEQGLQSFVTQSGHSCQVDKARIIGAGPNKIYYEVACKDGTGLILTTPRKPGDPAIAANSCLKYPPESNVKCILTSQADQLKVVDALATATGKCTAKDKRYLGEDATGSQYYEVACTNGRGYVLHADAAGQLKETIDCAVASGIAGGCTLTDTRAALTQQSALYSEIAKKAGFNCDVAKYAPFPVKDTANEVVELQCSNRPDGGVGFFPLKGGKGRVLDCLRALANGYKCSFTSETAVIPKLNAELRALNKGSCVVNGARAFGAGETADFVEVSCADGGPGWVIQYPKASETPSGVLNCAQAAGFGTGGCQLPTNVKH